MLETRVAIVTRRPPEEAFAFVADGLFENHPRWDTAITLEKTSEGPVGKGTTGIETRSMAG